MTTTTTRAAEIAIRNASSPEDAATVELERECTTSKNYWQMAAKENKLASNTIRNYAREFSLFEAWCRSRKVRALPATHETICEYLEYMYKQGKRIATVRGAKAGISHAHRLISREDVVSDYEVKRLIHTLTLSERRPEKHAKPLSAEALADIRATACTPRPHRRRLKETESALEARRRGITDIALCSITREARLRVHETAELRWSDIEILADGRARVYIARPQPGYADEREIRHVGPSATHDLMALQTEVVIFDDEAKVFSLSASQINRRIRSAAMAAGLGDGYSGLSGRAGMAKDLSKK